MWVFKWLSVTLGEFLIAAFTFLCLIFDKVSFLFFFFFFWKFYLNVLFYVSWLVKYDHVDIKEIGKFGHQNNISVNVYGYEDKKSFHYVLPPWPLQEITWIDYISLMVKNLIRYWWKSWADWYLDNIIMTTANDISSNIVCMAATVKRYWKPYGKMQVIRAEKNLAPRS